MKRWIETTLSIAMVAAWAAVAITAHEATVTPGRAAVTTAVPAPAVAPAVAALTARRS